MDDRETAAAAQNRNCVSDGPRFVSTVVLASWCGLAAGLLEVAAKIIRKSFDPNRFYLISRDFVWLIPLTNVLIFVGLGIVGWLLMWAWPRPWRWLLARGLFALTVWPILLAGAPQIFALAWLAVVLGLAVRVVPVVERDSARLFRLVRVSLPLLVGAVLFLAAWPRVGDWKQQARENARPLPPSGSPNVLLVVMDTVAAEHLSLNGYARPTSHTLVELAARGIRFDSARSTCSWTLPSHASMFTGKWFHEVSTGWLTPLDGTYPTLAEFLEITAMRRRPLPPITPIARVTRAWRVGSRTSRTIIFPSSRVSSCQLWLTALSKRSRRLRISWKDRWNSTSFART